ncbi:hypothetical protein SKAU_G00065430 [Synaphobranchus kaupii]|uniref:Uncharacterized protein n=1 Tax=Synaphobranchus kaupii TaxID=118154 RepID=A0A9Q1JAS8_SYNKA|nr:hypothetical protein SKAU_G00065430 [Synaphobranchus kaupii]
MHHGFCEGVKSREGRVALAVGTADDTPQALVLARRCRHLPQRDRRAELATEGVEQNKPESSPLHIQNPFEPALNVSKNVNATQLERLVTLCQESAWLLQQGGAGGRGLVRDTPWGLAALLQPSLSQSIKMKGRKRKAREPASERIKGLLDSLKSSKATAGVAGDAANGRNGSSAKPH